jgi:hypothetical protein
MRTIQQKPMTTNKPVKNRGAGKAGAKFAQNKAELARMLLGT